MWNWDQGHLRYCQFDAIRKIAAFVSTNDFMSASRADLLAATGLEFAGPPTHSPWRQYSRVMKVCLLVTQRGEAVIPTSLARVMALPGAVTCDEYLHFLIQSFTSPSPALSGWSSRAAIRFPLLFAVKYLLAKCAMSSRSYTQLDELISAYALSGFTGDEDQTAFIEIASRATEFSEAIATGNRRQAKESLQVISQISYFHLEDGSVTLSLDPEDATEIFNSLQAIGGVRSDDGDAEIARLANLFKDGSTHDFLGYPNTVVNDAVESGFTEGSKVKRTHITIERNRELRRAFFAQRGSPVCDLCAIDTVLTYPWTQQILDLHHLLPLASGARVVTDSRRKTGTTFADLIAVCPSCHRAIHRFYDNWLRENQQEDFADAEQAKAVYFTVKSTYTGAVYV